MLGCPSCEGRGRGYQVRKVCPYRNGTYSHASIVEFSLERAYIRNTSYFGEMFEDKVLQCLSVWYDNTK